MNIGIDIDGVISNFVEEFIKVVKEKKGITISEKDIIYHDLDQVLGIPKLEAISLINETLKRDLNTYKDADKYINLLSEKNNIYIITARSVGKENTEKWLKKNNINYKEVIMAKEGDKNNCGKIFDVMIDDNLKEAMGFIEKCKIIIVFDHPWNRTLNINKLLYRANNWEEIYKLLNK